MVVKGRKEVFGAFWGMEECGIGVMCGCPVFWTLGYEGVMF